jgi:hypothetical protein
MMYMAIITCRIIRDQKTSSFMHHDNVSRNFFTDEKFLHQLFLLNILVITNRDKNLLLSYENFQKDQQQLTLPSNAICPRSHPVITNSFCDNHVCHLDFQHCRYRPKVGRRVTRMVQMHRTGRGKLYK